jgi:hypothetical protein
LKRNEGEKYCFSAYGQCMVRRPETTTKSPTPKSWVQMPPMASDLLDLMHGSSSAGLTIRNETGSPLVSMRIDVHGQSVVWAGEWASSLMDYAFHPQLFLASLGLEWPTVVEGGLMIASQDIPH